MRATPTRIPGTRSVCLASKTCCAATSTKAEHRLKDFTEEAIPVIQTVLRDSLQATWCQPRLGAAATHVVETLTGTLQARLGDAAQGLLQHVVGESPPALQLSTYFTASAVVGVFRQRGSDYLLRLRAGYAGSLVSFLLVQVAGQMLRSAASPYRIFLDRNIRGLSKGKGKGAGGRGKGKGKGAGKGGKGGNQGKARTGTGLHIESHQP